MMKTLKKDIENLYPQFNLVEVLRHNKFKKTILLKRVNKPYILRLYSLEGINKNTVNSLIQFIDKLSKACNPHLVKFYEASHDADNTYLGVISQYHDTQYQCPLNEQEILNILIQICSALELFHPKNPHGKISLSNIFCFQQTTILGEMNNLFYLHQENYQDIYLLAPEFIKLRRYDCKSDIWMLGLLIFQLMFKEYPFKANNINILHKQILKGIKFTYHPQYSLNLNNLLRILLSYDPEIRPSISTVKLFAEQALISPQKFNIFQILPKSKVDQIVQEKKKEVRQNFIDNSIYLNQQTLKYPSFKPSKILKSDKKINLTNPSPQRLGDNIINNYSCLDIKQQFLTLQLEQIESKKNLSFTEKYSQQQKKKPNQTQISQKQQKNNYYSLYPVQLPKVLQYSFSKITFGNELSPMKLKDQYYLSQGGCKNKLTQYSEKNFESKITRSPSKILLRSNIESDQRSFSQRE